MQLNLQSTRIWNHYRYSYIWFPQVDHLENMVRSAEVRYGHKIWLMQAFGAEWQGRMIGISGDVAVYT